MRLGDHRLQTIQPHRAMDTKPEARSAHLAWIARLTAPDTRQTNNAVHTPAASARSHPSLAMIDGPRGIDAYCRVGV